MRIRPFPAHHWFLPLIDACGLSRMPFSAGGCFNAVTLWKSSGHGFSRSMILQRFA
jgi:hypothetical protein